MMIRTTTATAIPIITGVSNPETDTITRTIDNMLLFTSLVLGSVLLLRPGSSEEYCDQPVCMCVCLSVREHISGTSGPIFTKFCVQIRCGRGSVLLWWRCATSCTSGFTDDVTFGHSTGRMAMRGLSVADYSAPSGVARPETRAKSDVYECLVECHNNQQGCIASQTVQN